MTRIVDVLIRSGWTDPDQSGPELLLQDMTSEALLKCRSVVFWRELWYRWMVGDFWVQELSWTTSARMSSDRLLSVKMGAHTDPF